jgi:hypothetical protein
MPELENGGFVIIDSYEPYASKCTFCKYFNGVELICSAFPKIIPDEYLTGDAIHNKVDKKQVGDAVFTERI